MATAHIFVIIENPARFAQSFLDGLAQKYAHPYVHDDAHLQ